LDVKLLFFSTLMAHSSPVCLCTALKTVPKAPLHKASASTAYRSCNRSTLGRQASVVVRGARRPICNAECPKGRGDNRKGCLCLQE